MCLELPRAGWALGGDLHWSRAATSSFAESAYELRDNISSALEGDCIADAEVQSSELAEIVQRRAADSDAAALDGLEQRDWGHLIVMKTAFSHSVHRRQV